jgi:hypothetical protein
VTLVPPAAQAIVDRTGERTPVGQRLGAAAAELFIPGRPGESDEAAAAGGGAAAPGGTAPTTGPAAPQRGEPGAARRRPIRDMLERLRGRGPDEGMRAAEKAFSEEEKKAAKRTKERERYGAIGEMPTARTDVLPEAREPGGAKTAATRELEGAAAAAMSPGAAPLAQDAEAIMRGRDEALMGLVSTRKAPTGYAGNVPLGQDFDPRYGDLAYQYQNLQGLKQFNPGLYASEVRKLADEARERMRTKRGVEGTGVGPLGGVAEAREKEATLAEVGGRKTIPAPGAPTVEATREEPRPTSVPQPGEELTSPESFRPKLSLFNRLGEIGAAPTAPAPPVRAGETGMGPTRAAALSASSVAKMPGAPGTASGGKTAPLEQKKKSLKTFQQLQEEARRERMGGQ